MSLRLLYSAVTLGKKNPAWPGTMLSDSTLQTLQGLCTRGTQMVLALRGAVSTLCGYLSSRLVCPYNPRKRSNQASHPLFPPPWASCLFLHLQGTRNLLASVLLFTTHSAILRLQSHCVQSKSSAFIHSTPVSACIASGPLLGNGAS